ncbi:hypothetical protein CS369_02055 [Candidatus Symbiopectobacterium sp. 'North America']|uniref:hypothetical protein n=1 Tax=Candidatus Symbiopectobacterium sp. 'North America' TaxID=2794574 RepID=UPI0018CA2DCB|nr:hypothetical protein [Candidatus Symbiopectobacterium sp. 'North America']MBG6243926.1 hypothetical protein [Candidatus Symbiopectobacterium sp. 'North America']
MTTVNLNQLDNCVLNAQRISASNGEGSNNSTALAKKLHSIDNTPCVLHFGFTKANITSALNKQGTRFMGMPKMAMPMKPGYIRSLAHEQRGINNPIKYQGDHIYNPLNKHGNTFQGIPKTNASTRPGFIRSLADERRGVNNVVKYQGGPIYNPLNKHGNAFQGFSASMKREPEAVRDVSKRNSIDISLDDHLFEKYKLFSVTSEAEVQVAPVSHEGDIKPITLKDNKPYNQIAFLDVN